MNATIRLGVLCIVALGMISLKLQAQLVTLIGPTASCRALVPSTGNGGSSLGLSWTLVPNPANINNWFNGLMGVGYERSSANTYDHLFNINVEFQMYAINQTCYIRIPFNIPNQAVLDGYQSAPNAGNPRLLLKVKYDDGYIAYLNGTKIAERNPPIGTPTWNSAARTIHDDSQALIYENVDVSGFASALVVGPNILAIHGLNKGLNSSDAVWVTELIGDSSPPPDPPAWPELIWEELSDELEDANDIAWPNDGSGRLFIANLLGTIQIYANDDVLNTPFMDIDDGRLLAFSSGQGLLGLAFPPAYSNSGVFYVTYTSDEVTHNFETDLVLSRFHVDPGDPNIADPNSEEELLRITYPEAEHNSAQIRFGPDGMLYLAIGDGGDSGDPSGNAQNRLSLLGKMLRIDVEGTPSPGLAYRIPPDNPFVSNVSTANEIWALGLRHPRSWSFDSETDNLWLADATEDTESGQNEVNRVSFASARGNNFGWRYYDGAAVSGLGGTFVGTPRVTPIYEYTRTSLTCSVIGGLVYRGEEFPLLQGFYIFADYCRGISVIGEDSNGDYMRNDYPTAGAFQVTKFVAGEDGTVYFVTNLGKLYKIMDSQNEDFRKITDWTINGSGQHEITFGTRINSPSGLQYSFDLDTWQLVSALQQANNVLMTVVNPNPAHLNAPRIYYRAIIESGQ
jgi:glucose/arabinose dehydrogenase